MRTRSTPQQLLAVSFALIMLVSMGGLAFVGGAGAQTGGTYDSVVESTDVGSQVNVQPNNAVKTLGAASVNGDGSVDFNGNGEDAFQGVAVTPERVATLSDVGASFEDNPAAFLDAAPGELSVEETGSAASGAVFIEFAPQSEFSQINSTDDSTSVSGNHDYIVVTTVAEADSLTGESMSTGDIVAISVDNDDSSDFTKLASGGTHGAVLDALVGTQEDTLQDKNIDDALFAAGTFGSSSSTITAFDVGGRLVHSEQVTLEPGDGSQEQYFTSVTEAIGAAGDDTGDVITVADGTYDDGNNSADSAPITANKADLTIVGEDDPTLGVGVTVDTDANNVTIDGVTVEDADITLNGDDPAVLNSTVNASMDAITVADDVTGEVTIEGNDLNAADTTTVGSGDTGLDLKTPDSATVTDNSFDGFGTQIANPGANVNATALRDNNEFEQLAVAVNDTNQVVSDDGGNLYGSINLADDDGAVDNTIAVYDGVYDHAGSTVDIVANNVTLEDVDNNATIVDDLEIASGEDVDVNGFVVEGVFSSSGSPSTLNVTDTNVSAEGGGFTIDDVATVNLDGTTGDAYDVGMDTAGDDVTITDADGDTFDITAAGDVRVNGVLAQPGTTADGITVQRANSDDTGDITVENSEVVLDTSEFFTTDGELKSSLSDADLTTTGISVTGASTEGTEETVSVANVTVAPNEAIDPANLTGGTYTPTGVAVSNIDTSIPNNVYTVNESSLTGLGNGVGVDVEELAGASDQNSENELGTIIIDSNEIRGGSTVVGIQYDLPETTDADLTNNDIIGADVTGGDDSVGVKFEDVSNFGSGGILGEGDTMTFTDNVISGHAQIVADVGVDDNSRTVRASDYQAIYNDTGLNNEIGTLVIGADDASFKETYGTGSELYADDDQTYLPGSVNEAVKLVNQNAANSEADLVVTDPGVSAADAPTTYVDETVTFPDLDAISVEGETAAVTVETNFVIDASTATNNHSVTDLTIIDADSATPAIDVGSQNAQSTFDNLDITSNDVGVNVKTSGDDVNVVTITRSTIDVSEGTSGIVLDNSGADDRDGFTIDRVDIEGPGIDTGVGIDLSGVEKPGKEGLPVNLTVTNNEVGDFETLVALDDAGDAGSTIANVSAETFLEGVEDDEPVTSPQITIQDNTFTRAVVVTNGSGSDSSDDLFGSVDRADDGANANNVITVYNRGDAFYDHGGEVTIATEGVTVTGPTDEPGAADRPEDVVIQDPLLVSGSNTVTIEGLAVVPNDPNTFYTFDNEGDVDGVAAQTTFDDYVVTDTTAVIGYTGDGNLIVENTSVSTAFDESETPLPAGIAADDSATSLTVADTFVGDHDAGTTTGTGIIAESGVTFELTDSTLAGGLESTLTNEERVGVSNSQAYGVLAASGTTPDISGTSVTGFDQAGVNTEAATETVRTLTAGETLTITGDDLEQAGALDDQTDTSEYFEAFDNEDGNNEEDAFAVEGFENDPDVRSLNFTFTLEEEFTDTTTSPNVTVDELRIVYRDSTTRPNDFDYGSGANKAEPSQYVVVGENSTSGNATNFESNDDVTNEGFSSGPATLGAAVQNIDQFSQGTGVGIESFEVELKQKEGVSQISRVTVNGTDVIDSNDARALRVTDSAVSDNGGAGIETNSDLGVSATQYLVVDTTIENNNAGTGVDLDGVGLELVDGPTVRGDTDAAAVSAQLSDVGLAVDDLTTAGGVDVTNNDAGVAVANADDVSIINAVVSDNANAGVALGSGTAVDEAVVQTSTVRGNDVGIDVDGIGSPDTADITQNTIADNRVGLDVASITGGITVKSNDFTNTETDISSEDPIDATLNYFGTNLGPNDAAGVDDTVTYDPFLTESQVDTTAADVADTTSFGHDVVIPENNIVSVGFPAEPQADTVGEVINGNVAGAVYKWNQDTDQFNRVSTDEPVGAFDVLVVENVDDKPTTAAITYKDESSRTDPITNTFTFDEGLNFVPAQQTGTVEEALFAGDGSDYVAQPFSSGENLYGDRDAGQARDEFASPSEDGFGANFASGVGDEIVHPHVGYFVIVNDESNIGNTRSEQIPSAGVPTAADIDERTGATPATFELSSASVTSNTTGNGDVDVIVDVENVGDVEGDANLTATARSGFSNSAPTDTASPTLGPGEDTTVELTINGGDLNAGDQVRVEIRVDGTDESVTVTTQAEAPQA